MSKVLLLNFHVGRHSPIICDFDVTSELGMLYGYFMHEFPACTTDNEGPLSASLLWCTGF